MFQKKGYKEMQFNELSFRRRQRIAARIIAKQIEKIMLKSLEVVFASNTIPSSWKINKDDNRTTAAIADNICINRPFKPLDKETEIIFEYLQQYILNNEEKHI